MWFRRIEAVGAECDEDEDEPLHDCGLVDLPKTKRWAFEGFCLDQLVHWSTNLPFQGSSEVGGKRVSLWRISTVPKCGAALNAPLSHTPFRFQSFGAGADKGLISENHGFLSW